MNYCPFGAEDCIYKEMLAYDPLHNINGCKYCFVFREFKERCTCTNCHDNKKCPAAFDPYNTNGDCLMMK